MRKLPRSPPKVPRFSPKPPRPKPKVPRPTPNDPIDPNDPTDPPRSKTATRRPASCHRPWPCPEMSPNAGHDSRARFGRPKASSLIPLGARIAGATAEAARCGIVRKFAGRSCAASSLSSDKGATPAGGGKPSAYPPSDSESRSDALAGVQIQSKLVRLGIAALGFGNMHCPKGTAEGGR